VTTILLLAFVGAFVWAVYRHQRGATQEGQVKKDVETLLLMGVDQSGDPDEQEATPGENAKVSAMSLIIKDGLQLHIVQIPVETLVPVQVYYTDGTKGPVKEMQIGLQYAYGKDSATGAELTVAAVETLCEDIHIDSYMVCSQDAIAILQEKVDQDVELETDWSDWSASDVQQVLYSLKSEMLTDWSIIGDLYTDLESVMSTDMEKKTLQNLGRGLWLITKKHMTVEELPGEMYDYTSMDAFQVDAEELHKQLEEWFYE